jgi:hypothetical protein
MNKYIISLGVIVSTLGFYTYSMAIDNQISVCVKKDGTVHVIGQDFKRDDCKKNEVFLSWNTQGPKGDQGIPGIQGPKGDSGFSLPEELKPTLLNISVCKQRSGNGLGFSWTLENGFGSIPNKLVDDDYISSGISWGELKIQSNLAPEYNTYIYKSNGTHYSIAFPSSDHIGNGSPYDFSAKIFWNGFILPISTSGTWNEAINQCQFNKFGEGF